MSNYRHWTPEEEQYIRDHWQTQTEAEMAAALDKTDTAMGHAAQTRVNEHFLWQNSAELALTLLPKKGATHG